MLFVGRLLRRMSDGLFQCLKQDHTHSENKSEVNREQKKCFLSLFFWLFYLFSLQDLRDPY